jgi:FtsP/CotA-like multicopper oxidase with cupredoxin domain
MKKILLLAITVCLLASCKERTADLTVGNMLDNVVLERISIGDYAVEYGQILPGMNAHERFKSYNDSLFPIIGQISFYMVSGDNRVFLQTKEIFTLDEGMSLVVNIDSDTEVVNRSAGSIPGVSGR